MMHIPSLKSVTKTMAVQEMPPPAVLYMPMKGYRGNMSPLVSENDYIRKFQPILQSEGLFGTIIHSPVSGFVKGTRTLDGLQYLVIDNDFKELETERPAFEVSSLSKEEILNLMKEFGIVGSGGAGFPTHVKYNTGDLPIDTLIVNGAECEPYLSADYALMKNWFENLLKAIALVQKLLGAKKVVTGIEKQHSELKEPMEILSSEFGIPLKVKLLQNKYPQGSELQLIKMATGKEVPKGDIPAKHGVVVSNVGTLYSIYQAFFENRPNIERIVTLSGELSPVKGNFRIKIGTPAIHILEFCGLKWGTPGQTIIMGGPMMGKKTLHPEMPVTKVSGGFLILPSINENRNNCIGCGYCVDVCPQRLMPLKFARHDLLRDTAKLKEYKLANCIECGACTYICPSHVPLMQHIVSGKQQIQMS